jgi:formate dehydrogenase subunit delta
MSGQQHLVKMANDIGDFFRGEHQRDLAVAGIANHIRSFWTRKMRDKLIAQMQHGETGLDDLPRAALLSLMEHPNTKPNQPPGGDAG